MNGPAWTDDLRGARVTVLGLGLFGGGVAAARWAAARWSGSFMTPTSLRQSLAMVMIFTAWAT